MADFSDILKELRNSYQPARITQKQLAKKLSISHTTISAYERGTRIPTLDNLVAFANFFDVSIDYLAGRSKYNIPFERLSSLYVEATTYEDLLKILNDLLPSQRLTLLSVARDMSFVAAVSKSR